MYPPSLSAVRGLRPSSWSGGDAIIKPQSAKYPWATVGTAFDYLARLLLGERDLEGFIAFDGADRLAKHFRMRNQLSSVLELRKKLEVEVREISKPGILGSSALLSSLAESSYALAIFEQCFRSSINPEWPVVVLGKRANLADVLNTAPPGVIDDLEELARLLIGSQPELFAASSYFFNPRFGIGSQMLDGADADLIVDGRLIEIKTNRTAKIEQKDLWQIVGYALSDFDEQFSISEVGIYFSRHGIQIIWKLDDLIELLAGEKKAFENLQASLRRVLERRGYRTATGFTVSIQWPSES